nr:hypothetical protein Iba_chr11cCG8110 [Ipomoea batatas]
MEVDSIPAICFRAERKAICNRNGLEQRRNRMGGLRFVVWSTRTMMMMCRNLIGVLLDVDDMAIPGADVGSHELINFGQELVSDHGTSPLASFPRMYLFISGSIETMVGQPSQPMVPGGKLFIILYFTSFHLSKAVLRIQRPRISRAIAMKKAIGVFAFQGWLLSSLQRNGNGLGLAVVCLYRERVKRLRIAGFAKVHASGGGGCPCGH